MHKVRHVSDLHPYELGLLVNAYPVREYTRSERFGLSDNHKETIVRAQLAQRQQNTTHWWQRVHVLHENMIIR